MGNQLSLMPAAAAPVQGGGDNHCDGSYSVIKVGADEVSKANFTFSKIYWKLLLRGLKKRENMTEMLTRIREEKVNKEREEICKSCVCVQIHRLVC